MDSTIPSAMTQEGSDNSAETKPPRSWSWLWFRPIQLQGLTTSERRVIRREMRFGPKQIAWTASSIALVGFISGLSIAVVILKLDDPGFPMVIFKGVLSLVFVSCGWFFLAICFVFRLLTVLMIMNVRVCDSCGQRAQSNTVSTCRECNSIIHDDFDSYDRIRSVASLSRPRLRAALAQCRSPQERRMVWQQVNPVSRTSINWRWLVTSLICIAVSTALTMMSIDSLFMISDGSSPAIAILIFEFTMLFAVPIFAIGMLVFIAQANIKTSIERAGIRLCRRCLNRAYDESQTKCEACQLELKEPGPMRSKIAN